VHQVGFHYTDVSRCTVNKTQKFRSILKCEINIERKQIFRVFCLLFDCVLSSDIFISAEVRFDEVERSSWAEGRQGLPFAV